MIDTSSGFLTKAKGFVGSIGSIGGSIMSYLTTSKKAKGDSFYHLVSGRDLAHADQKKQ